jgi:hypothetical protein
MCASVFATDKPYRVNAVWLVLPTIKMIVAGLNLPPDISASYNVHQYIVNCCDSLLLQNPDYNLVIAGDLNKLNCNNLCAELSLVDTVREPTRGNNILDHILISATLCGDFDTSDILPPLNCSNGHYGKPSDHKAVYLRPVCYHAIENNVKYHRVLDFRESSIQCARKYLDGINFFDLYHCDDVNKMCDILYSHLYYAISMIPAETIMITTNNKKWITPLLKLLINRRWKAWRSGNMFLYCHYRDKVKNAVYKAKLSWANKCKKSVKGAWAIVNNIRGKDNIGSLDGLLCEMSSDQLLEQITKQFSSIYNWNTKLPVALPTIDLSSQVSVISVESVFNFLTSAGSDMIAPRVLSIFADYISGPVCAIYNQSVRTCVFPSVWKIEDICPTPKCRNPSIDKLRPIAKSPILGKILEKIQVIENYTDIVKNFGDHQHAYRRLGSCTSALIQMHDTVTRMLDDPSTRAVRIVCFDMSSAFTKLRHDLLLNRMVDCSLDPMFINWCSDYLKDRIMRVKLKDAYGSPITCPSSVPQGSCIGPYLFALYMGSLKLPENMSNTDYKLILFF